MPTVPWGATQEHILISEAKTLQATNPGDSLAIAIRSALAFIRQQDEATLSLKDTIDELKAQLSPPRPSREPEFRQSL